MRLARSDQSPNKTKDTNSIEYEYVAVFHATGSQSECHFVVGAGEAQS
jgi:hypothetical protein